MGKALAETINERLGAALGNFLSDIAIADAERQRALRSAAQSQRVQPLAVSVSKGNCQNKNSIQSCVCSARYCEGYFRSRLPLPPTCL
jgi:hypothetical protein